MAAMAAPRLAVLGLSHGLKFVNALKKSSIADLVAVADLDPERAVRSYNTRSVALSEFLGDGVALYMDYKDLLGDARARGIDGVIAALPNDLHAEAVDEAAKAGVALMLEKPIACTMEEASRIVKTVNGSNMAFMVAHHRRFSKKIIRVKEAIDSGALGRILGVNMVWAAKKPDWYFEQKWRITEGVGGPLLINMIHDIDNLRYLVGEIAMVQAHMANVSRGNMVEDTGVVIASFKNGAVASIFLSDNAPSPWFYEACSQEYEFFHPSNYDCYAFFGEKASLTFPNMDMHYYEQGAEAGWHRPIKQERLTTERFDVIEEELKHFCAIIAGTEKSRVTAEDAAESLRVIEAIKESSKTGRAVHLA